MKLMLSIMLGLGILIVASFVAASFLPGSDNNLSFSEETSCGCGLSGGCGCGGNCTAESNCGLATCGATKNQGCGCSK